MNRKGNATLSCALDVVRYLIRCPFEKTSRRDTLEKLCTSAPFLHQHTHESREKKRTNPFLFCRHFFISRAAFIALLFSFASPSSRRSCGWLCVPFREAYGVRDTTCLGFSFRIRSGARAKGTTTTRQKGKRVQDVEDQDDNKRWATRFRAR